MFLLILQILFVLGLGGMLFMAAHKMPALVVLAEEGETKAKRAFWLRFKKIVPSALPKERLYKLKDLKTKEGLSQIPDKKDEIDSDGDYWQKIRE